MSITTRGVCPKSAKPLDALPYGGTTFGHPLVLLETFVDPLPGDCL